MVCEGGCFGIKKIVFKLFVQELKPGTSTTRKDQNKSLSLNTRNSDYYLLLFFPLFIYIFILFYKISPALPMFQLFFLFIYKKFIYSYFYVLVYIFYWCDWWITPSFIELSPLETYVFFHALQLLVGLALARFGYESQHGKPSERGRPQTHISRSPWPHRVGYLHAKGNSSVSPFYPQRFQTLSSNYESLLAVNSRFCLTYFTNFRSLYRLHFNPALAHLYYYC